LSYVPAFIVVDFETAEDKHASTEFYRPAFRVVSCAFSWLDQRGQIRSEYTEGENATYYFLERIAKHRIPIIAHNAQFEMGVVGCRFPALAGQLLWHADTMRLVQNYDNGGDDLALETLPPLSLDQQLELLEITEGEGAGEPKSLAGLGLSKCVQRILRRPDHKQRAYKWIRENVPECKGKKEARFLNRLPPEMLKVYNIGDTEETLRLYVFITDYFKSIGFDWRRDHALYFNSVRLLVSAKVRGVPVERAQLQANREGVSKEISDIEDAFRARFVEPIGRVERNRLLAEVRERKTLKGRKGFVRRVRRDSDYFVDKVRFNIGSNKQLEALFVNQLGMRPKFRTDKGAPAFRSAVLGQWGDGGLMLQKRRKRLLVLKQTESLLDLSAFDSKWHVDLKACGTSTGRFSGGSHG
jgi:hypothetical protein